MKQWWNNLSIREQLMLAGGGFIALVIILYFLIWLPFNNAINNKQQQVQDQKSTLVWMQNASKQLQSIQYHAVKARQLHHQDLLTLVEESIKQSKLSKNTPQLSQSEANKVEVKFNKAPFDDIASWLIQLWQQYAIQAVEVTIIPQNNGLVQADIVLTSTSFNDD